MLKPLIEEAVAKNNTNLHAIRELLNRHDTSLNLTDATTSFIRGVHFGVEQPKGQQCWYNDGRQMPLPEVNVVVPHATTFGQNHVIDVLGHWKAQGDLILLKEGNTSVVEQLLTPDVLEAFQFTFEQLQTIFLEFNNWYIQFSRAAPDTDINTVQGPDNYHRIAAAMYYSPIFSQWVQHLKKRGFVKLAPVCDRLTRSNSFRYQFPMSPELHTALSTGFNLLEVATQGKENEDV
jgi:hypothetical protein